MIINFTHVLPDDAITVGQLLAVVPMLEVKQVYFGCCNNGLHLYDLDILKKAYSRWYVRRVFVKNGELAIIYENAPICAEKAA